MFTIIAVASLAAGILAPPFVFDTYPDAGWGGRIALGVIVAAPVAAVLLMITAAFA